MLTYILVGAGAILLGVGSTWYGLRAVAARARETDALRARGLWTLVRAWLQPIGYTSIGVALVLAGPVSLLFSYFRLTIAPQHVPPSVRVITAVALVIRSVAILLLGCGLWLWLAGGIASARRDAATPDATPDMVDHDAAAEATDHDAMSHMPSHVGHQQGLEENGQTPHEASPRRPLVEFGFIAYVFTVSLLTGSLLEIISTLPDMVTGHFTVDDLVKLVLVVLGLPVVMTTLMVLALATSGVLSRRKRARRLRMGHGCEPHHP